MNKQLISKLISIIVILTAVIVMIGWILDIQVLKSILPVWVTMKFITALSFFFSGILTFLLAKKEKGEINNFFIIIISFALLLLMITFLISLFIGVSTGIEKLFVKEVAGAVRTTVPGVPAIPTIICFILIALAGMSYIYKPEKLAGSILFGILIFLIGVVAVIGYLANIPVLYYSIQGYTSMAFHTAILFVLIGISLILLNEGEIKK